MAGTSAGEEEQAETEVGAGLGSGGRVLRVLHHGQPRLPAAVLDPRQPLSGAELPETVQDGAAAEQRDIFVG